MDIDTHATGSPAPLFRHEALLYAGEEDFLAGVSAFVRQGLAAGEPTLVAVERAKLDRLRDRLGNEGELVRWVDLTLIGRNPARITSLWYEFATAHGWQGPLRGIGEPIWPGRTTAELAESQRHEALLNLAFADVGLRLLCPYDAAGLDPAVLEEARHSHPVIVEGGVTYESPVYLGDNAAAAPFDAPLAEPRGAVAEWPIGTPRPGSLFELVFRQAADVVPRMRAEELAIAVVAAAQTLQGDDDSGALRMWTGDETLVCELSLPRPHLDPLAGRRSPSAAGEESRGLWLANQLCDLVELRSFPTGTAARLHVAA